MIKFILSSAIAITSLTSFAGENYEVTGKVNGIRISKDKCYISFESNNLTKYSNAWHFSDGDAVCKIAQMAYILGSPVSATNEVNTNNVSYANTVKSIIIGVKGIHWPPYHQTD
ncbi:hypothetical protein [Yersinia aleksiciae]|uniref:hypothetical protein n=1 Tax=Yersinia aleksiciae TaxID=263819 RepID=UPI00119CD23E|nr:hypothetical protein [Yersinia aleksiciae]